jgi:hypothetical protein
MKLDDIAPWLIGLVGLLTCLAVRRRLGWATVPLAGLFVVAADYRLFWMQISVRHLLRSAGWLDSALGSPAWNPIWTLLPVILVAVFSWSFAAAVRKQQPVTRFSHDAPAPGGQGGFPGLKVD